MKLTTKKLHKLIQEQLLLESQVVDGLMGDNPRLVMKYLPVLKSKRKIMYRIRKAPFLKTTQVEVSIKILDDELFSTIKRLYNRMSHEDMNIDYVLLDEKKELHMLWLQEPEEVDDKGYPIKPKPQRQGPRYVGKRK